MTKKRKRRAKRVVEWERTSAESFQAIGEFVVRFSLLEFLTRLVLAEQLPLGEFAETVTGALEFRMLCKITHTVLSRREPERTKQLDQWARDCMALSDQRARGPVRGTCHVIPSNPKPTSAR